jgi:Ulp1 family protease
MIETLTVASTCDAKNPLVQDWLLIPVYIDNTHWTLVVVNVPRKAAVQYDSLGSSGGLDPAGKRRCVCIIEYVPLT